MDPTTRWLNIDVAEWDRRIAVIARLIPRGSAILDVGAGTRELEKLLPPGCVYIPLDFVDRGPDTLICDLNARRLEKFPEVDIAVCSGVLEYVRDVPRLFAHLYEAADRVIASYAVDDEGDKQHRKARKNNGWINAHTTAEIIQAFGGAGFSRITVVGDWEAQRIFSARR